MGEAAETAIYQLKHFKYSSHYWILRFLERADRPLHILDVGSADGYLGAILKRQGHHVVGIEADPARAEKASACYNRMHVADIEAFDFPFRDQFDLILCADVLEHVRDPQVVLKRVLPCLKESGQIIVSVPNIANFFIRAGLLLGRFDYRDRGILDRTHLRFFTLKSLRRLLSDEGCAILEMRPTPVPMQLVFPVTLGNPFAPLHELHYAIVRLRKPLFAYQFVVRAVKTSP